MNLVIRILHTTSAIGRTTFSSTSTIQTCYLLVSLVINITQWATVMQFSYVQNAREKTFRVFYMHQKYVLLYLLPPTNQKRARRLLAGKRFKQSNKSAKQNARALLVKVTTDDVMKFKTNQPISTSPASLATGTCAVWSSTYCPS